MVQQNRITIYFLFIICLSIHIRVLCQSTNRTFDEDSYEKYCDASLNNMWSDIFEQYVTRASSRQGKVLHQAYRIIPPNRYNVRPSPNRRIDYNSDHTMFIENERQYSSPIIPHYPKQQTPSLPIEVSETDLYLLQAIEKLVHRVEHLEHRLKRAEKEIFILSNLDKRKEPVEAKPILAKPKPLTCPKDFHPIGKRCYHMGFEKNLLNWESSSGTCKTLGGYLAEFEEINEEKFVKSYFMNNTRNKNTHYWIGGLNPGLLWIWANSGRPINPINQQTKTQINNNISERQSKDISNSTIVKSNSNSTINYEPSGRVSNLIEINGTGRCLMYAYDLTSKSFTYSGQDCSGKKNYLCEIDVN